MILEYTLLTTLAFHHIVLGGILVISVLFLNTVLKLSAEIRSWLWMTSFLLSTLVPFTLFSSSKNLTASLLEEPNRLEVGAGGSTIDAQLFASDTSSWHLPSELVFNFSFLLSVGITLWLLGSVWRSASLLRTFARTRKQFELQLTPVATLKTDLGINIFASCKATSPMVVGLWNPRVILPQSIVDRLDKQQLTAVVLHERAHIHRKDNWFRTVQEFIAIVFWWSPVIRFLDKKIHIEREIACDLRAVAHMKNSKQYAQSLLDCAKLMVGQQQNVLAMGLFNKKKELRRRIAAVLKNKTKSVPSARIIVFLCFIFSSSTLYAAQLFSPRINIIQTASDARTYSLLPRQDANLLLEAVKLNDLETINTLLDQGVDINTPVTRDGTALMIAVKQGGSKMVRDLIELGADVNQASIYDGNPLIIAAKTNNLEIAQLLIDYGATVDAVVERDETALINASTYGYLEMIKLLVESGADVNLAVRTGFSDGYELRSPLNRARNQRVKTYLISQGALK